MRCLRRTLPPALFVALCSVSDVASAADDETSPPAKADHQHEHPANRLAQETSPYLLLHAHNPVDWYPWGPEAFEKAQKEDKPIFLSIGYSSCYWCHVMERETFSDEETAAYMNEHFVNIKVDREERPDVDDIYMVALQIYHQAIGSNQGGGWPLSMFLTPEGKPIAGGTYFPPRPKRGLPGFLSVMQALQKAWTTNREQIAATADVFAGEVRRVSVPGVELESVPLDQSLVDGVARAVKAQFDPEFGGLDFNSQQPDGPKFPVPTRLMLLQSQPGGDDSADAPIVEMLDTTLDHMLRGGIRDHLGGGFHRYSTDRQWLVPHFEKMLYDNAQLAEVYCDAFTRTNAQRYRDVAEQTYAFVLRELTDPAGGFYSALDAETDGIEGKHYVWSQEEIGELLGEDAALFNEVYGINGPEHFEHGRVLHLPRPVSDVAADKGVTEADLQNRLSEMREKLLAARQQRPELLRDDKILTSWNGLMIRSLAGGGQALDRPDLITSAERAAQFILDEMRDDEGRLLRTHREDLSKLNAYLDDYAFLADGLITLHRVTGDQKWLAAARQLTDDQIDLFWDDDRHGFFFTSDHHEELLARTKNAYDSVLPSGNSVSVRNLVRLAELTGEDKYLARAEQTLQVFASRLKDQPGSLTFMAVALGDYLAAAGATDRSSSTQPEETAEDQSEPEATVVQAAKFAQQNGKAPLILAARTDPRDRNAKVSAKAYLSVDKLPPGGKAEVAIVVRIKDGWHINANPARPEGQIPTELKLKSGHETKLEKVAYPKGHDFRMAAIDEPLSVYEKDVVLRGVIEASRGLAGQTEELELRVRYQACDDRQCLRPTDAVLKFNVPVAASAADVKPINQQLFEPKPRGN